MKSALLVIVIAGLGVGLSPTADDNIYILQNGTKCPPHGTATSKKGKAINILKNRNTLPKPGDIDEDISLEAMLAPGDDDNRFDEKKAAKITGVVIKAFAAGTGESCNCKAKDEIDMDTHIELGPFPNAPKNQRVIVEVSPRFRKMMKDQKPSVDWSSATLKDLKEGIKGKWVEVTGWMLFDFHHADESENTNPGNKENWRATAWEIHPVTAIKALTAPPTFAPAMSPGAFNAIQGARLRDIERNPERRAAIRKKLASYLEGLSDEEREEIARERKERAKEEN